MKVIKHVKAMGYVKEKDKSKIERKAIEVFLIEWVQESMKRKKNATKL